MTIGPQTIADRVDANRMLRLAASGFEVLQALKETIGKSAIEMNAKPQVGVCSAL